VVIGELEAELVPDARELVVGQTGPISQQPSHASRCAASIPSDTPLLCTFWTEPADHLRHVHSHPPSRTAAASWRERPARPKPDQRRSHHRCSRRRFRSRPSCVSEIAGRRHARHFTGPEHSPIPASTLSVQPSTSSM
jgi:hypothetical protein